MKLKQRLMSMIRSKVGLPEDVQNLVDYMEEIGQGQDCVIYQGREFPIALGSANGDMIGQPMVFRTNEERAAFGAGIHHGMKLMGGSASFMGDEQTHYESDEMDEKATYRLPHRKC